MLKVFFSTLSFFFLNDDLRIETQEPPGSFNAKNVCLIHNIWWSALHTTISMSLAHHCHGEEDKRSQIQEALSLKLGTKHVAMVTELMQNC